jgi:hypothetical protein
MTRMTVDQILTSNTEGRDQIAKVVGMYTTPKGKIEIYATKDNGLVEIHAAKADAYDQVIPLAAAVKFAFDFNKEA